MSDINIGLNETTDTGAVPAGEGGFCSSKGGHGSAHEASEVKRHPNYRYLKENRLQQVIAAITVLALSHEYRRLAADWVYRLTGIKPDDQGDKTDEWRAVFEEHTESFRKSTTNEDNFSLILRRVVDKNEGQRPPVSRRQQLGQLPPDLRSSHDKLRSRALARRTQGTTTSLFLALL